MEQLSQFNNLMGIEDFRQEALKLLHALPKEANTRKDPSHKLFFSEIYSFFTLIQAKKKQWKNIQVKMRLDKSSDPDVEIIGLDKIHFFEITEVGFDHYEYKSMEKLNRCHFSMPVSINRNPTYYLKEINANTPYFEFQDHDKCIKKNISDILKAVQDKKIKYINKKITEVALLVSFDDYGRIFHPDKSGSFSANLRELGIKKFPFAKIIIVGRGQHTIYLEI